MKVLVVSDTHGRDESLEMAVALEQPFDYLIHCDDHGNGTFRLCKYGL